MSEPPRPAVDQRLFRAVAHPSRIAILEAMVGSDGLSLGQISERLGVGAANANYHLGVLLTCGAIEAVGPPSQEAEPLFRLGLLSQIAKQSWREISPSVQADASTALLQSFLGRAAKVPPGYGRRGA
jgi:DNA-binding transcriptional ArsR family regulator